MDGVFTCSADVAGRNVAVVVGCVTAQDVCQIHLGSVQLGFGRGFVRSGQWGVAQCGVAQSAHCTGRAVNADRFATVLADFDGVGQFQLYATFNGVADNVAVAFDVDRAAQRVFVAAGGTANVDAFGYFFTYFVQCVLNGAYGRMFRAVRFGDGKARRCNLSGCRINVGVQRFGYWVQLADVHCVGIRRTFGYVGNFVAAVVQTVFGQRYRSICRTVGNIQTVGRQYAVASSDFRCNQSCIRQRAVACFQGSGSYTIQRNIVIQLDGNIVAVCRSGNVVAAFNADSLTQFFA